MVTRLFRAGLLICFIFTGLVLEGKEKAVNLRKHEWSVYSQEGDDGVIEKIFDIIGVSSKYYVEFGARDGHDGSNTKYLSEHKGWSGLLMDCDYEDASINLHKHYITAENVNQLFEFYDVPNDLDLLSIDVDGIDFYIWKELDQKYRPRLVIIEFNAFLQEHQDRVIPYDPYFQWQKGSSYFGASITALYKLGRMKGYSLIYVESHGNNLFFIPDELVNSKLAHVNNISKFYSDINKWRRFDPNLFKHPFVSFDEAIKYEHGQEHSTIGVFDVPPSPLD